MSNPWRSEAEPGVEEIPKHREPRRGGTMIPWGAAKRTPGACVEMRCYLLGKIKVQTTEPQV
jgi:hypothetical protein